MRMRGWCRDAVKSWQPGGAGPGSFYLKCCDCDFPATDMVRRSVIIAESMGGGMKQISLGAIAIAALLTGPVMAADMPVKAPVVRAPAAAAIFNWSGFSVGGFVGGAWSGRVTASDLFSEGPVYPVGGEWSAFGDSHFKLKASVIGGVTAGVNWQAAGSSLVWGLEGEFGYMRLKGSGALPAD